MQPSEVETKPVARCMPPTVVSSPLTHAMAGNRIVKTSGNKQLV